MYLYVHVSNIVHRLFVSGLAETAAPLCYTRWLAKQSDSVAFLVCGFSENTYKIHL